MPVETLTLPKDIVTAARTYAAREDKSIDELFADALRLAYGIDCSSKTKTIGITQRRKPTHTLTSRRRSSARRVKKGDDSWLDELDPFTRSLVGALKSPPEDEAKSYRELLYEALAEKYGLMK